MSIYYLWYTFFAVKTEMSTAHYINALTRINSTVRDLFIYLYNLSPLELDILLTLITKSSNDKKNFMTLEELTRELDRDKSTVFRSLQKLVSLGICLKETRTIKEGGLYHVYSAIDIESFKLETEKRVKELEKSFTRILKKFEADMRAMISDFYRNSTSNNNKTKGPTR
jgi:predicted transcriptional regulator